METLESWLHDDNPSYLSDTKYRDIADGNYNQLPALSWRRAVRYQVPRYSGWKLLQGVFVTLNHTQVRYQVPRYSGWKRPPPDCKLSISAKSDTKYRDIADGNYSAWMCLRSRLRLVRYQVPRYSGWKPSAAAKRKIPARHVENQVPRYSGYKSIAEREIPSCKEIFSHDD